MAEDLKEQVDKLQRDLNELKSLFYKDNHSNLQVFRKKTEFKGDITSDNIQVLTKTGGTAVIADNTYTFNTGSHTQIQITTKNGIITNITIS